jgi:glucan 1,3-beta-glucosidase
MEVVALASRDAFEWTVGGAFTAAATAAAMLCALALARWADGAPAAAPASAAGWVRWVRTGTSSRSPFERWLGAVRFLVLFGAAVVALTLAFDPRYRDFPLAGFASPVAGLALLAWAARGTPGGVEERALALVLVATAPVILWRESLANVDALAWVALCGALAASVVPPRQYQQPEQEGRGARLDAVEDQPRETEAGGGERQA